MRSIFLILLGLLIIGFVSSDIPDDCESSILSYWKFDGNVFDSVGGYDGIWEGSEVYDTLKVNDAVELSGSKRIIIPNVPEGYLDSSFTIEMWINSDSSPSSVLFDKREYKIEWVSSFPFSSIVASVGDPVVEANGLSFNGIYHIALVWDSSGSNLALYVDGVKVDETVFGSAGDANGDLVIGEGFSGLIDELAIYDSDLDESVIRAHYDAGNEGEDYCDASGAGGSSSTRADFDIDGCNFDVGGEIVGVSRGTCSVGDYKGQFYCDNDLQGLVTTEVGLGCAMGNKNYEHTSGDDFCCPPGNGYFCNNTGQTDYSFVCEKRVENCFDQTEQEPCENLGCIWWNEQCLPDTWDLGCVDYDRGSDCEGSDCEEACNEDSSGLGQNGVGTEGCGAVVECNNDSSNEEFSVTCSCAWDENADVGQRCKNEKIAVETFYSDSQATFSCSNSYSLGECVGGEMTVTWDSVLNTTSLSISEECLDAVGCSSGQAVRYCGEPIVKLPGFSFFAFFSSLLLIGVYYISKERRFLRKV